MRTLGARRDRVGTSAARKPGWRVAVPTALVVTGIVAASSYGLLTAHPYRGVSAATVTAARAQDACSLVVAVLLAVLARSPTRRAHLLRLGLFAYVAYSYAIYATGISMNRVFLVYVVLVSASGAALLDGLVRLEPSAYERTTRRGLERGTGWFLIVVAALFAGLWLSTLVPYAVGGPRPTPEGPGGVPYPVFVLDLTVVLPALAAVGSLLLRGRRVAGPLAVVVLVKVITLFTALWAGTLAGLVRGDDLELGPDAGPSLLMLLVCVALLARWITQVAPVPGRARAAAAHTRHRLGGPVAGRTSPRLGSDGRWTLPVRVPPWRQRQPLGGRRGAQP